MILSCFFFFFSLRSLCRCLFLLRSVYIVYIVFQLASCCCSALFAALSSARGTYAMICEAQTLHTTQKCRLKTCCKNYSASCCCCCCFSFLFISFDFRFLVINSKFTFLSIAVFLQAERERERHACSKNNEQRKTTTTKN